ncbi:hypothetical protein ABIF26_002468 [Bradyrhizobium elkanii]
MAPIAGNSMRATAMPAGHELMKMAIAVAISRPANQSATILVIRTFRRTPPMPAVSRPAICTLHDVDVVISNSPTSIIRRPARTTTLSP